MEEKKKRYGGKTSRQEEKKQKRDGKDSEYEYTQKKRRINFIQVLKHTEVDPQVISIYLKQKKE